MNQLLTMREVQGRLRISEGTLRKLINTDPDFRTVKLRKRRLMSENALGEYIRAREEAYPGEK
jgi:hypothetical protein